MKPNPYTLDGYSKEAREITLKTMETGDPDPNYEPLHVDKLVRSMTPSNFTYFMEKWFNSMNHTIRDGVKFGQAVSEFHPSVQANAVTWLLGILMGIASQKYTDARNDTAVKAARLMVEAGKQKYDFQYIIDQEIPE